MEYIDLRELIKKSVNGEIQLNKAIMLTSRDRTETTMVTFLNLQNTLEDFSSLLKLLELKFHIPKNKSTKQKMNL